MESLQISASYRNHFAIGNLITCVYLPTIILWLNYTENLYNIGKHQRLRIEVLLILGETLKYLFFWYNKVQPSKKSERKKSNLPNILKAVVTLVCVTGAFYIAAILFGAPLLSNHQETFTFALVMTVLTMLPCCLYLGADIGLLLLTSLTAFEGNELYKKLLMNIRLTIFGAWLGAVVIPLDWDKPYQEWPIPCVLGAMCGCFIANLWLLFVHLVGPTRPRDSKV